jgi:hypothetical protein
LFPLREAARAAAAGDLQALSLYLNAWTTLQYPTFLTDPDRILVRQLLEGELHFQQIVELDPEDEWARAYLGFLRVLFTHDFEGIRGLRQELSAVLQPLCQKTVQDWDLNWICAAL